LLDIDTCFNNIRNLYLNANKEEQEKIGVLLKKISNRVEIHDIDDISMGVEGIDKITKLPNRESLFYDISILEDEAMLMYFHINQIGALKELYGQELAYKIIVQKAEQLSLAMSGSDVVIYNIDLQRFAVLVKDEKVFSKYLSILKYSIFNNIQNDVYDCERGYSIVSDFTVGVAYGIEHLYHRSHVALQKAILEKVNYKEYDSTEMSKELQRSSLDRLKIYKSALHEGNIVPYFQPIVNADTTKVMKYEALARLITENGEVISPYQFLNSAIEDKTFEFFTRQITQKIFIIYEKSDVNFSMNLTYENISSPSMMDYIKNRLEKYGGNRMTFEIVETEEIKDYGLVEDFILMVKEYGAKVSIDDFGSGYSNFTNIIKLNIDYIKIDGTLITKLLDDQKAKNMVAGLIQFAKSINVETIAEFVSSHELYDEVKALHVDYIQGYYFGEPKPAEEYGLV